MEISKMHGKRAVSVSLISWCTTCTPVPINVSPAVALLKVMWDIFLSFIVHWKTAKKEF
jgi:hypothetical protein